MSATAKTASKWWIIGIWALLPAALQAQQEPVPDKGAPPGGITSALAEKPAGGPQTGAFNQVLQASCKSCGGGLLGEPAYGYGGMGCDDCEGGCVPGQKKCVPCVGHNCVSRMFCAFYDCLCCPDPCYEPRWIAAANSAFFVDGARPITQMRIRWDHGRNLILPDRAEYFWPAIGGKGPPRRELSLNYDELSIYNEAAIEKFSIFTEMPYRLLDPVVNNGTGGFGDLKIGTKTMFCDCELTQMSFQMTTWIPTGNFLKGLGIGHVALEPSLIFAVKLYPETYLQMQLAEWIPIGGTQGVQGSILHYHFSLNHVICRPVGDTQLIATLEYNGYSFQSGSFTNPINGALVPANSSTYSSIGPGIRFVICDKIDFGFGTAFSVSNQHFADQLYRTEFRWRF